MKTDTLIEALTANLSPADGIRADRMFVAKHACGMLVGIVLMSAWLGVRAGIASELLMPMFWLKLGFPAAVAFVAFTALRRLCCPGVQLGRLPFALAAPFGLVWLVAGAMLVRAGDGTRMAMILGETSLECPAAIATLAVPVMALTFSAARDLAPTRLSVAGSAAGLFAGAAAALAYALHSPEMDAPFLAVWYVLGMMIPTAIGAVLGRPLLRW